MSSSYRVATRTVQSCLQKQNAVSSGSFYDVDRLLIFVEKCEGFRTGKRRLMTACVQRSNRSDKIVPWCLSVETRCIMFQGWMEANTDGAHLGPQQSLHLVGEYR